MNKEYDSDTEKHPYTGRLKKVITIRVDNESIHYFKNLAEEIGLPYQSLINLFLKDCTENKRKPNINWHD